MVTTLDDMRSWSCLPNEILSLILSNLVVGEIANFRVVCKGWKATPPPLTDRIPQRLASCFSDQLPSLLFKTGEFNYQLSHPIYVSSNPTKIYELPRAILRASNFGWLLMTQSKSRFFFINPLTKEKIELPDMEDFCCRPKLTFSSAPTSLDCLVFCFDSIIEREITIYTIKPGQVEWTFHKFPLNRHFKLLPCNPILFKGLYYCLGEFGSLLIYDPKEKKPRWVGCKKNSISLPNLCLQYCRYYMVESEGDLLLVYNDVETEKICVFKFLGLTKRRLWEKIDDLRDTMLFVSEAASFAVRSFVKGLGNKIYFPRLVGDDEVFYSLKTQRYHCFDGGSWNNMNGAASFPDSTWIVPCMAIE